MILAVLLAQVTLARLPNELIVSAGVGHSVNLFDSTANRDYVVQTISWGRTVTPDLRFGPIRGRFAWAGELTPLLLQTSPGRLYGFGIAPVVWRWNFPPRPKWSVFGELSMGGLWTTDPIPEGTGRVNFTAHWGGGIRFPNTARRSIVLSYRFQHISNGNQLSTNPGVNSHVVLAGLSFVR